jgi:4-hydroxy-tetrahydrodipicolinate synthase
MTLRFQGCLTALVTPFRDGGVDYDALTRLVDWQIESGIDGLVAVGTTGESATLDIDEHIAVIAHVVKVARGRVPVIAGAGANATSEALELSRRSEDVGADGLLHVTPYYNKPTQDGLFRHFEAIARHGKLPIVLYNVPGRTGCDLLPETIERLADVEHIVAIKEATGNLGRAADVLARVGTRLSVLSGDEATAFTLYALGGHGVISVVSNDLPREMSAMWDAAAAGDWATARALHFDVRALDRLLFTESNPIPVKAALALLGRCGGELRLPMTPASPGLVEQLRSLLHRRGLL